VAPNFPAIDLADAKVPIAIQVTATPTLQKVKKTLEAFGQKKLNATYGRLIVLNTGESRKHKPQVLTSSNGVKFCTKKDIWTVEDLVKTAHHMELTRLTHLADFLGAQLGTSYVDAVPKEIETFIRLMELLSDDAVEEAPNSFIENPDPENKITKRFADHAPFLKRMFTEFHGIYGATYDKILTSANLGHVRIRRLGLYLKYKSDNVLSKTDGDPQEALEIIVKEFSARLALAGVAFDESAIRFFLVEQLIRCNVFPNKEAAYV
jgi:hypothetical protein